MNGIGSAGMGTTSLFQSQDRLKRQVKGRDGAGHIQMLEDNPAMPLSKYNSAFGGKPGAAVKAMRAMQGTYGPKKGESVFYATKNKRKAGGGLGGALAAMQRKR